MKYQCSKCNEVFTHTAKIVVADAKEGSSAIIMSVNPLLFVASYSETAVCPFCHNIKFSEYVEPEADIVSVKSVPLEEVDGWLLQGYIVKDLYAKTGTLVKKEVKVAQP